MEQKYLQFPAGSFFTSIEEEWFEKFKPYLVLKRNKWFPSYDLIKDKALLKKFNELYKKYKDIKDEESNRQYAAKQQMLSLMNSEPK